MPRTRILFSTALIFGIALTARALDDKVPDIHDIMTDVNGKKGLVAQVKSSAKQGNWDEAKEKAKKLKELGEAIGKNKPPKGDEESWKKLTKKYAEETAAIAAAAEKQDALDVDKAAATFANQKNCATCHNAHRP